jgi:spore germination protein KC
MKINDRNKLILFIIFIFISSILLNGCSKDNSELSEINAVMGIGIDIIPGDEPILVTLEIAGTKMNRSDRDTFQKGSNSIIEVSKGKTVFGAIENFSKRSSVIEDFSHAKTIILSKEFCESGISEVLDYMDRDRQFRSTNWLFVSDNTAREILESRIANEDITSKGLDNMMKQFKKSASILPVNLNDFIIESESESKTSFIPLIELNKFEDKLGGTINVEKMAIFKNNRFIGVLTNEESKSLLWISDNKKGHMGVSPFKEDEQNKDVVVEVYKKSSKIIPYITEQGVRFKIECTGYAVLKEVEDIKISSEDIKSIENNTESVLKNQLKKLINKSQKELNADFINFSKNIFNDYPTKWYQMKKNWNHIFPDIKCDISFKINITKIGFIKNMDGAKDEEGKTK